MGEIVDWTAWPLLRVRAAGLTAEEVPAVVGEALRAALDRGGPFAAVVEMPPVSRARRPGGALEQVRLVRPLRGGLAERCRGLAFVMPAASLKANTKVVRSGPKIWGCPTYADDDPARAIAWAGERLAGDA